jgi:hypothetical protein
MATDRQIAANRRNAKKSSGPRSAGGKARSRRNALRHGLSIASRAIPAFQKDVMLLARALSPAGEDIADAAIIAADAEIDMLRIRKWRAALIEESRGQGGPVSFDLANKLDTLERYERRAFARRNKALRALEGYPNASPPRI